MSPSSHGTHILTEGQPLEGGLLAEAFSDFMAASSRLEGSYRELQAEVAELSLALSERNRALSESLSENRAMGRLLERILDVIPCGVLVLNGDTSVLLANPEACRLLAARNEHALHAPADGHGLQLGLECDLAGEEFGEGEQELAFGTGNDALWIAMRQVAFPVSGDESRPDRPTRVLTLCDISARKRMEAEREAARDAVALAQVSALLAHEIRNPLAGLELFAGLLADVPERSEEWLSHLRAGIRSLSGTVNNVLTLHGSATAPQAERVAVGAEIASVLDFLQPLALQARIHLSMEEIHEDLHAQSSRSGLRQILLNLCSNALRHTQAGGSVTVACPQPQRAEDPVRISVTDTGCGIPHAHLDQIFELGFSGAGASSGLGLTVCDRLARQHGGSIQVTSRVGSGSTFTLELLSV